MTRSVALDVLRVDVGSVLDQSLNDTEVASKTRNMKRRPKVIGARVHLSTKFNEYLNERSVALTGC